MERTVEFTRKARIDGEIVDPGAVRTFGTAFATELVSGGKARFVPKPTDPVPVPVAQSDPTELPEDHPHIIAAQVAKKGK